MLFQNFKGFLTLALMLSLVATGFYFYKGIVEPGVLRQNGLDQFVVTTDNVEVTPEIELYHNKAIVRWDTPYESTGVVLYCTNIQEDSTCKKTTSTFGKSHEVNILNLQRMQSYYYKIGIDGIYYPAENEDYYQFVLGEDNTPKGTNNTSSNKDKDMFTQAMKSQDLEFDLNKDGKVSLADYSFYLKTK